MHVRMGVEGHISHHVVIDLPSSGCLSCQWDIPIPSSKLSADNSVLPMKYRSFQVTLAPTWDQTCLSLYQPVVHGAIPGRWGNMSSWLGIHWPSYSPSLTLTSETRRIDSQLGESHLFGSGQTISVLWIHSSLWNLGCVSKSKMTIRIFLFWQLYPLTQWAQKQLLVWVWWGKLEILKSWV